MTKQELSRIDYGKASRDKDISLRVTESSARAAQQPGTSESQGNFEHGLEAGATSGAGAAGVSRDHKIDVLFTTQSRASDFLFGIGITTRSILVHGHPRLGTLDPYYRYVPDHPISSPLQTPFAPLST